MIWAFVIIYWLASIGLWVGIMTLMRSLEIKKNNSIVIGLGLSIIFLMLVLKLSILNPWCYFVGSMAYSLFVWFGIPNARTGWQKIVGKFTDVLFWPQSLCLNMFLYSVRSDEQSS